MEQLDLIKKRNDISRFVSKLNEDAIEALENHVIEANYEIDSEDNDSILAESVIDSFQLDNDVLTEDVKKKIKVIFNAAVNEKMNDEIKKFVDLHEEHIEAYGDYVREELEKEYAEEYSSLEEKLDSYLSYFLSEWAEDNKLELETGIRNQISESIINGLKNLFVENYIDVPENKVNLIGELEKKVSRLYDSNVKLTEDNKNLINELNTSKKTLIIEKISKDMTDFDKDKLVSLSKTVKADGLKDFKEQVTILKESLIDKKVFNDRSNVTIEQLNEGRVDNKTASSSDDRVKSYEDYLRKLYGTK